jgi:16S rRNA processing protein RimM
VTTNGIELGVVDHLIETGANDVLVVKGDKERLIPFVRPDVVTELDKENGFLKVEWDPDF